MFFACTQHLYVVPAVKALTVPFLTALSTSTAELVPTFLLISQAVAVLGMQNKV